MSDLVENPDCLFSHAKARIPVQVKLTSKSILLVDVFFIYFIILLLFSIIIIFFFKIFKTITV